MQGIDSGSSILIGKNSLFFFANPDDSNEVPCIRSKTIDVRRIISIDCYWPYFVTPIYFESIQSILGSVMPLYFYENKEQNRIPDCRRTCERTNEYFYLDFSTLVR